MTINDITELHRILEYKGYRRVKRETDQEYAKRLTSIFHRGWAFIGHNRHAWFENECKEMLALLPKI